MSSGHGNEAGDVPSNFKRSSAGKAPVLDLSDLVKPFATATTLRPKYLAISDWNIAASDYVEILAKFHHSKKHLVWQIADSSTNQSTNQSTKFLLNYSDVSAITVHDVTVGNNYPGFVAINFSLNVRPRLFQEVPNREHRHARVWIKAEHDITYASAARLPQVHTLIFDKRSFTDRHNNIISQFERLILGDPYFTRIVRIDATYPPVGHGFNIIGRRSMEQLRDKVLHFLETLHHYIEMYSPAQLSLSINFDVHHTFKLADNSRMETKPHEAAIAINFEDIHAIAEENGDSIISREEIQYYMQISKIGENGICSFRHLGGAPTKARGKLSPRDLVPAPRFNQGKGMDQESPSLNEPGSPNNNRRRGRGRPQKAGNEPAPKNIRVAMMFSKACLVAVCGPEVVQLWADFEAPASLPSSSD